MVPFVVAKKLDHGVNNPIVARLTLQNIEILQKCAIPKATAESIQALYLNELTPKLLRCSQIAEKLRTDTEKLAASYKPPGKGETSVELPQVMQLEEECRNYLYEAKNFLRDLLKVFNLLFGTSFEEGSEWTMAKKPRPSVIGFAEANFQKRPDHIRYLQQLPRCVETFVKMRNAVEHPGGHSGDLVIRNFRFEPDGKLSAPDGRTRCGRARPGVAVPGYDLRLLDEDTGAEVTEGHARHAVRARLVLGDRLLGAVRRVPARCSRGSGCAPATPTCGTPTVTTNAWVAPATCSRRAASGCRRWR